MHSVTSRTQPGINKRERTCKTSLSTIYFLFKGRNCAYIYVILKYTFQAYPLMSDVIGVISSFWYKVFFTCMQHFSSFPFDYWIVLIYKCTYRHSQHHLGQLCHCVMSDNNLGHPLHKPIGVNLCQIESSIVILWNILSCKLTIKIPSSDPPLYLLSTS